MKRFISTIVMAAAATAAVTAYLKKLAEKEDGVTVYTAEDEPAEPVIAEPAVEEKTPVEETVEHVEEPAVEEYVEPVVQEAVSSVEETVVPVVDSLQEAVEQAKQDLEELSEALTVEEEPEETYDEGIDEFLGLVEKRIESEQNEAALPEQPVEQPEEAVEQPAEEPVEEEAVEEEPAEQPVEQLGESVEQPAEEEPAEEVEQETEQPIVQPLEEPAVEQLDYIEDIVEDEQPVADQPLPADPEELFGQPDEPVFENIVPQPEIEEQPEEAAEVTEVFQQPAEEMAVPVEKIVEEAVEKPAEPVAEETKPAMSPEELLASLSQQYPEISVNKIATIIKTINRMRETFTAEKVDIEHFIAFANNADRDMLANVFTVQGMDVKKNTEDLTLSVFNTLENNESELLKTILTLANDAVRYHGTYKGWAIK